MNDLIVIPYGQSMTMFVYSSLLYVALRGSKTKPIYPTPLGMDRVQKAFQAKFETFSLPSVTESHQFTSFQGTSISFIYSYSISNTLGRESTDPTLLG